MVNHHTKILEQQNNQACSEICNNETSLVRGNDEEKDIIVEIKQDEDKDEHQDEDDVDDEEDVDLVYNSPELVEAQHPVFTGCDDSINVIRVSEKIRKVN